MRGTGLSGAPPIQNIVSQTAARLSSPTKAFKSYDEAGVSRRVQCLKYLVLASMLMESKVWGKERIAVYTRTRYAG